MSVSYEGKTYPVCCSGCAAAFNDEPLRWLSKLKDGKPEGK
jgi:YHS domain-containing protein